MACQAWLLAGGAHHTSFSQAVTAEQMEDLAGMLGVEHVRIGHGTDLGALKKELRWNDAAYRLGAGSAEPPMTSSYDELKEQAWQANMEIPRRGLAIYTFGNVSAFDAGRAVFAIKPSGVAYESLTAADMVVVDLEAKVVEGHAAAFVRHEDPRGPVPGLPGHRRDRPHPFDLRHGVGAGRHADPDLRHDARGPPGGGCSLHGAS